MFDIVNYTLAADIATAGTATIGYPPGRSKGNYSMAEGHVVIANQTTYIAPRDFTLTFNANTSNITLTWKAAITLKAGTTLIVQLERAGENDGRPLDPADPATMVEAKTWRVDLGSPTAKSATVVLNAAAVATTAEQVAAAVTLDVPRALQFVAGSAGDTTQTVTVKGTDYYGAALTETVALNGTTIVYGKKAFKTVTSVKASAALTTTLSVGSSDILGLPVFVPASGAIVKELQDGVAATAGTFVAGDQTAPSATTGDIRGTYLPNAATDGGKGYVLVLALTDPADKGVVQYAG